jgi:hypothetical protein
MIDSMPLIQFGLLIMLLAFTIGLRRRWNNLTVTLMASVVVMSVGIRTIDELSNALFGVDVINTQVNWLIRWCVMAAVALFLLRAEQLNRKAVAETAKRVELERQIAELKAAALAEQQARVAHTEVYLEKLRGDDQAKHAHDWNTLNSMGTFNIFKRVEVRQ